MIDEAKITRAIIETAMEELLENLSVDVAVAGAGPAGLTAAYYLGKGGLKVVVFERRLNYGGGMPGGGMLFPRIVVQEDRIDVLRQVGVRLKKFKNGYYTADSVEAISKLAVGAIDKGVRIYPGISIEDVVIREEGRICGVVVNWTAVKMAGLHVDPLAIMAKWVVDATGHDAEVARVVERKMPDVRLATSTGKVIGERPMWAQVGEEEIVKHTEEVYPGLILVGMAVCSVYGLPRMGPIFGGMLFSGKAAAELILKKLKRG